MKLYIITVATHNDYYLPYLKESCHKNGYDLIILGYGEKWQGFNWRNQLVLNFLNKTKDDDIICFIDGFDVICCKNLKKLPEVFHKLKSLHKCKIIIGEHKFIKKYNEILGNIYFSNCKNILLNAGTYIGNSKDLKDILHKIYYKNKNNNLDDNNKLDDQILLTEYCKNNLNDVYIDTKNEIFLTLQFQYNEIDKYMKFQNNEVIFNNNSPFFIHGPGETYLDNIIIKLNYNYDYKNKVNYKLYNNFYNKMLFRINNGNINYKIILYIIIIILIIILLISLYYIIIKKKIKLKKI